GRGWANLNTHEIDQQLRVGVPVSSAVPVVAGFLAGPVVGGALVAADLLLDKPLSRLTSVRYHVSGPWDALKVDDEVLEVPDDKPRAGADKEAP
ncbi:AsmA-like C-terminal region-containing protein, partial [Acinetobacter baumannii]